MNVQIQPDGRTVKISWSTCYVDNFETTVTLDDAAKGLTAADQAAGRDEGPWTPAEVLDELQATSRTHGALDGWLADIEDQSNTDTGYCHKRTLEDVELVGGEQPR